MTAEQHIITAIKQLIKRDVPMDISTHLRDDLGLDSARLIELTVLIHSACGVDLGRRAAELKLMPETVGDLITLVEQS